MQNSKEIDWSAIEAEYRAGQISIRLMASIHGVPESTIRYRASTQGWERDLTVTVQKEVRNRLLRANLRSTEHFQSATSISDEDIVNEAAERAEALITSHRRDIRFLRDRERQLLEILGPDALKTWVGQYQGRLITADVNIPVTELASALNALASVMSRRIQLEREAFNLDEHERQSERMLIVMD